MAKKPETYFKEKVLLGLRALPNTWAEKIQQRSIRGTPDILACVRGLFVAMELKATDQDVPDGLQVHKLNLIKRASGLALVVTPSIWPSVYQILADLAHGRRSLLPHPNDKLAGTKDH
jgi:hypothetical protein